MTLTTSLPPDTHRFLVNVSAPFRCRDDGSGIGVAEGHMSVGQRSVAECPGCVHITSSDILQLWNPLPDVISLKDKRKPMSQN